MKTVALTVLLMGLALCAQGPGAPRVTEPSGQESSKTEPSPDQLPSPVETLHVTTTLVEVTVVARDKQNRPVTDLKQDDFELYDEGQRQKIQFFTVQRAGAVPVKGAVPAPPSSVSSPASPAHFFSNRGNETLGPNAVTVILIDEIDIRCKEWPWVRDQLIQFLRHAQPRDRIGIYVLSWGGISVLHDITQDCSALVKGLATWNGKLSRSPHACAPEDPLSAGDVRGDLNLAFNGSFPPSEAIAAESRNNFTSFDSDNPNLSPAVKSFKLFSVIANHLAGIPGRKNVIWVSDGFPIVGHDTSPTGHYETTDYYDYEQQAMRVMNQANVAVYSVEAQGLLALMPGFNLATPAQRLAQLKAITAPGSSSTYVGNDIAATPGTPVGQIWQQQIQAMHNALVATQATLSDVADRTGGRAFINTNDLTGAIRSAFDDSLAAYTLGFYPEEPRFDGKFHRLQVKVVGRPDVNLNYRRGYVDARGASDPKGLLQDAVWSPLDASGISLTARMEPGKARYNLSLSIGLDGLSLQWDGSRWKGTIHLVLVQNDDEGGRYYYFDRTLGLALRQDTYRRILATGFKLRENVALNPKATSLRVIVLDEGTGNLGSLTIPIAPSKRSDNKG